LLNENKMVIIHMQTLVWEKIALHFSGVTEVEWALSFMPKIKCKKYDCLQYNPLPVKFLNNCKDYGYSTK
jgi:hypothetical protein